jgi:hypothetical protein
MYGMVNKAIQALIIQEHGEDMWFEIMEKSGLHVDVFVSMEQYPDEFTVKLIQTACEVFDTPPDKYLEKIGKFWITYTSEGDYKDIFKMAGDDFVTFLRGLNDMHTRIQSTFVELKPPSFTCSDITENSLHLHYYSIREGFAPMVVGLVKGLANKFNTLVQIHQLTYKSRGDDHDEFLINYSPKVK